MHRLTAVFVKLLMSWREACNSLEAAVAAFASSSISPKTRKDLLKLVHQVFFSVRPFLVASEDWPLF